MNAFAPYLPRTVAVPTPTSERYVILTREADGSFTSVSDRHGALITFDVDTVDERVDTYFRRPTSAAVVQGPTPGRTYAVTVTDAREWFGFDV